MYIQFKLLVGAYRAARGNMGRWGIMGMQPPGQTTTHALLIRLVYVIPVICFNIWTLGTFT